MTCPDAETLAAFAEGFLSRDEAAAVVTHLDECEDCMAAVEALNETIATRNVVPMRGNRTWWLTAAAAMIVAIGAVLVIREQQRTPMARLIELAPPRPVEARLSGGFPWASYRGPMRAEDADADPKRMKLVGTAGDLVADAERDQSASAQRAAGVALLVIDKPLPAIERLRGAVQASPNDGSAWSDLAAAQYSAALRLSRPSLLPEALVSVDRALRIDARHAEALFNRALIVERLGLAQEARAAWQRYLEIDPASPWAVEARERLAKLDAKPSASSAQKTRTFAEAETLGRWAEAFTRGDAASAKRELDDAREVGDMLVRTSGESLLREAVRAIDEGQRLAEAHTVYRRGRIAYARGQLDAALADLNRAAALFARSPMSLVARYYASCVRFDRNDVADARNELQSLLADADANPRFIALGAQVRWELALARMVDSDWSGALPLLEESSASFDRLDERNHLGFVESLLADTLLSLGRIDDAWAARTRAFTLLSADAGGDRLPASVIGAAQMELRSGRLHNARALLGIRHAIKSDVIASDVLVQSALVSAALDDSTEAASTLREATTAANRIVDPGARAIEQTLLQLAGAAVILKSDPARASAMLTSAIDAHRASGRIVYLPECYLLRARAALRRGEADAAAADLESGIETLSHVRTGGVVGTGVLNAGVALFEDAIRLSADRGDVAKAFAYAERSRGGASSVRELQQHLEGSDTAVLEIATLPEGLVAICVTANDASMARGGARAAALLYDAVIRPFDHQLDRSKQLIVVAGGALRNVPFAALYDETAKRYLVERMAISTAMNASALRRANRNATSSLLAVVLPSGESNAGLPESAPEVADVSSLYASSTTIAPERATFAAFADAAPSASVIHIAGHTQRQPDESGSALLFAHERVTWSRVATCRLTRSPIVVLAACETLNLGDAFLAAGATDVVGTLAPIADADARELFASIHRHLASGHVPSVAVRAAQLESLSRRSEAWRALALVTRCIDTKRS